MPEAYLWASRPISALSGGWVGRVGGGGGGGCSEGSGRPSDNRRLVGRQPRLWRSRQGLPVHAFVSGGHHLNGEVRLDVLATGCRVDLAHLGNGGGQFGRVVDDDA